MRPSNKGMKLTSALPRFARWHGRRSQLMPGVLWTLGEWMTEAHERKASRVCRRGPRVIPRPRGNPRSVESNGATRSATEQGDAADEGRLEAGRGMVGGVRLGCAVPAHHHRGSRPSQLIAGVVRTMLESTRNGMASTRRAYAIARVVLALLLVSAGADATPPFLSATSDGAMAGPPIWSVEVSPSGRVDVWNGPTRHLSKQQVAELRDVIRTERFFQLKRLAVQPCFDCSYCMLEVTDGGRQHFAALGSVAAGDPDWAEAQRFLRIWRKVKVLTGTTDRTDACGAKR